VTDVRDLLVNLSLRDNENVLQTIRGIQKIITGLTNKPISFDIDTTQLEVAQKALQSIEAGINQPLKAAIDVDNTSLESTQMTLDGVIADTSEPINMAFDVDSAPIDAASTSIDDLFSAEEQATVQAGLLQQAFDAVRDSVEGLSSGIEDAVNSISLAQVAFGAAIGIGANQAFKEINIKDAITEQFVGQEKEGIDNWLASAPPDVSYDERAKDIVTLHMKGVNTKVGMALETGAESLVFSKAATMSVESKGVEGMVNMLQQASIRASRSTGAQGNIYADRILKPYGLRQPTQAELSKAMSEVNTKTQGFLDASSPTGRMTDSTKKQTVWLQSLADQMTDKTKGMSREANNAAQKILVMNAQISNLKTTALEATVPVLEYFVGLISELAHVIEAVPGAPQFIGFAIAFSTLAVVGSKLSKVFNFLTKDLEGMVAWVVRGITGIWARITAEQVAIYSASELATVTDIETSAEWINVAASDALAAAQTEAAASTGVLATAMTALEAVMAWPLLPIIIIGALIVGAVLLAYKMGLLTKAWESFQKSAIGGGIIRWFEGLGSWVMYLAQGIDEMWVAFNRSEPLKNFLAAFSEDFDRVMGFLDVIDKLYSGKITISGMVGGAIGGADKKVSETISNYVGMLYWFVYKYLKMLVDKVFSFVSWIQGVWDFVLKIPELIGKYVTDLSERIGNFLTTGKWETNADKAKREKADKAREDADKKNATSGKPGSTPKTDFGSYNTPVDEDVYFRPSNSQYYKASQLTDAEKADKEEFSNLGKSHSKEYYEVRAANAVMDYSSVKAKQYVAETGGLKVAEGTAQGTADIKSTSPNAPGKPTTSGTAYDTHSIAVDKGTKVGNVAVNPAMAAAQAIANAQQSTYKVPSIATGGRIMSEGFAYLHSNEFVKSAGVDRSQGNSDNSIINNINVVINGVAPSSMTSSGFDRVTETKLTKFIDDHMTKTLRHRIAQ